MTLIPEECLQIGFNLAKNFKKYQKEPNNNKRLLELPNFLNEY